MASMKLPCNWKVPDVLLSTKRRRMTPTGRKDGCVS